MKSVTKCGMSQGCDEHPKRSIRAIKNIMISHTDDNQAKATRTPNLSSLCDDTLERILSYCNLPSFIHLTRCTSHQLRDRLNPEERALKDGQEDYYCQTIWKHIFTNHNFAIYNQSTDYYHDLRHRLELFHRIAGKGRGKKMCYSLPDRHFHFVPVLPSDRMRYPSSHNNEVYHYQLVDDDFDDRETMDFHIDHPEEDANEMQLDDPPPVEFTCDSFSLTSHSVGEEYVILNPFSGSIEVYNSILDNAISSEENLMELAMMDASENILRKRNRATPLDFEDERSEDLAGEAIHSRIQPKLYDTPPSQVLFSVQDYFDLDINEYFGRCTPFGGDRTGNVTVDWVGVDTHVAMSEDCKSVRGNLIGAARLLTMESEQHGGEDSRCTEVLAWSNIDSHDNSSSSTTSPSSLYTSKFVCRAAGSFYFLDICAKTQKLYATFQAGTGGMERDVLASTTHATSDLNRSLMDIDDESLVGEDGEPIRMSRSILRLPLVKYEGVGTGMDDTIASYFPKPEACIVAQYPVSSFSVDISGQILLIGTVHGTVEIWHTGANSNNNCHSEPRRLKILSVREFFVKRSRSMTIGARCRPDMESSTPKTHCVFPEHATQDDLATLENENELPHKNPTCKVSQIYLPRHLLVQSCGFVTKQRDSESGTTLLLWQTRCISSDRDALDVNFQIVAMINLPLSSQCHPEVHYDGRRLIVFGRDHVGLIFLVYHVLGSRYDQDDFFHGDKHSPSKTAVKGNEESGGVINLFHERRIKFVNRIRHAGLGGLEYFDSCIMTANERFIVVNTKNGNLIASDGTRNASEGMLVIDLQEHDPWRAVVS